MANILPSRPRQSGPRRTYAVVASQYHATFVDGLVEHFRQELDVISPGSHAAVYRVPGAFEIPLMAQELLARGGCDAVVAFGVIIEGDTGHAWLIGKAVTEALLRISLEKKMPVIHEVLLVKNEEQARVRCLEETINRGTEAARVAVRMVQALGEIRR